MGDTDTVVLTNAFGQLLQGTDAAEMPAAPDHPLPASPGSCHLQAEQPSAPQQPEQSPTAGLQDADGLPMPSLEHVPGDDVAAPRAGSSPSPARPKQSLTQHSSAGEPPVAGGWSQSPAWPKQSAAKRSPAAGSSLAEPSLVLASPERSPAPRLPAAGSPLAERKRQSSSGSLEVGPDGELLLRLPSALPKSAVYLPKAAMQAMGASTEETQLTATLPGGTQLPGRVTRPERNVSRDGWSSGFLHVHTMASQLALQPGDTLGISIHQQAPLLLRLRIAARSDSTSAASAHGSKRRRTQTARKSEANNSTSKRHRTRLVELQAVEPASCSAKEQEVNFDRQAVRSTLVAWFPDSTVCRFNNSSSPACRVYWPVCIDYSFYGVTQACTSFVLAECLAKSRRAARAQQ